MADQQQAFGDWRPIQSPTGQIFYFNARTNETSWVPPTPPSAAARGPTAAATPAQNNAGSPTHQSPNSHIASPMPQNHGSYPSPPPPPPPYAAASSNASFYPAPPPASPPANPFPPQPAYTFYPQHPSPGYRPPPGPLAGNPYQPPQPPRPQSSGGSTSFKSLLGSAVKAALFPAQFDSAQYGNPGQPGQGPAARPAPVSAAYSNGQVIVNGVALDPPTLLRLQMTGVHVIPGRYWYDRRSGGWGLESGPCLGAIAAGQALGGPLRADASGPTATGVFINGRQIHALDALRLQAMGITPMPGRWWVEADGRFGLEGSFVTVGTLAGGRGSHGMGTGGSGSGSWSWSNGENFGGQGDGFGYVGGHDATGRAWSVDYGN